MQRLRDSRGVHVETAITAAGGLAGLALLRSAGSSGISIEAELSSSTNALMLFFSGVLVSMKLSLQEGQSLESIPAQNRPHKQAADLVKELETETSRCLDVLKIPRVSAAGRDILGGRSYFGGFPAACGACIAAARFIQVPRTPSAPVRRLQRPQLSQSMLEWRVGIKLAYEGFIQVARTEGTGHGPIPDRPHSPPRTGGREGSITPKAGAGPMQRQPRADLQVRADLQAPPAGRDRDPFRRSPLPPPPLGGSPSSPSLFGTMSPSLGSPASPGPGDFPGRPGPGSSLLAPGKIRLPPLGGGRRTSLGAQSPPSPTWPEPRPPFAPP